MENIDNNDVVVRQVNMYKKAVKQVFFKNPKIQASKLWKPEGSLLSTIYVFEALQSSPIVNFSV